MNNNILENDGFIFAIISEFQAKNLLKKQISVFRLHSDYTESLIEDENDINDTLRDGEKLGVEIGFKPNIFKDFNKQKQVKNFDTYIDLLIILKTE